MQGVVYRMKIRVVGERRQRILDAWEEIDQLVIDVSIKQWRARLRACVGSDVYILSISCESVIFVYKTTLISHSMFNIIISELRA